MCNSETETIILPPNPDLWLDVTVFADHLAACRHAGAMTDEVCAEPHDATHVETTTSRIPALLQIAHPLLARYQAQVEQGFGDNFLLVFGARQMHEDDPERSLHTAHELQTLARQQGLHLSIGIHAGMVLVRAAIGASDQQQSDRSLLTGALVMGSVVTLATRLQAQGEAGDTLVSKAVYHQTRGAFDFLPSVLTLRGTARPLTA